MQAPLRSPDRAIARCKRLCDRPIARSPDRQMYRTIDSVARQRYLYATPSETSLVHIYNTRKVPIELVPLPTAIVRDIATRSVSLAAAIGPEISGARVGGLIDRAGRHFFELGRRAGLRTQAEVPKGPPPAAFRDAASGLVHVVYHELVVRFASGVTKKTREAILKTHGFQVRRTNPFVPEQVIVHQPDNKFSADQLIEIANDWTELDEVIVASPNFVSQFQREAPPKIRPEEWHLDNKGGDGAVAGEDVDIRDAWAITRGKPSIIVAVLDDGVDIDHPNLKSRIWKNPKKGDPDRSGRDFFLRPDHPDHFNPRPKLFRAPFDQMAGNDIHGTPCAGVIAAAGVKGGSTGAAPRCRILPVKIFHADDLAPAEHVANAIRYAAGIAQILSCSWSGPTSPDIELALEDVTRARDGRGALVFCASGNENRAVGFPARDPNAVAVGASTDQAKRATYSNVGVQLAVVAPSSGGVRGIFTTDVSADNRGFNVGLPETGGADGLHTNDFGGTSSATPLAAGVAALMLSVNPKLSATGAREILTSTADKIGSGYDANGHSTRFGFGRVNAGKAVAKAKAM
jgi:subtilisin family serine protease